MRIGSCAAGPECGCADSASLFKALPQDCVQIDGTGRGANGSAGGRLHDRGRNPLQIGVNRTGAARARNGHILRNVLEASGLARYPRHFGCNPRTVRKAGWLVSGCSDYRRRNGSLERPRSGEPRGDASPHASPLALFFLHRNICTARREACASACMHWDFRGVARPKRFELLTPRFVVWCSIQLSYGRLVRPLSGGTGEPI